MDIQLNKISFGILVMFGINKIPGGYDPVTKFGRSAQSLGIVTEEPIANPAIILGRCFFNHVSEAMDNKKLNYIQVIASYQIVLLEEA